jgi:hypothetical protein
MQWCNKCGEWKEFSEYYKDKSKRDGLGSCCKACDAEGCRRYREKNKEKIKEQIRRYNEKNKEKIAERGRKYREKVRCEKDFLETMNAMSELGEKFEESA